MYEMLAAELARVVIGMVTLADNSGRKRLG